VSKLIDMPNYHRDGRPTAKYMKNPISRHATVHTNPRNLRVKKNYASNAVAAGLQPCTKKYLDSLIDPASENSKGACIPSGFPIPSQKVRAHVRGMWATGTTGVGFITMRPVYASNGIGIYHTSTTSVLTTNTVMISATNQVSPLFTTLPFDTAQCNSSFVDSRLVSMCLRVRYTGPEETRGGIFSSLEEPDHNDLYAMNLSSMSQYDGYRTIRPSGSGEWFTICYSGPTKQKEVDFTSTAFDPNFLIAIMVQKDVKVPGTGDAQFEYEGWINIEYCGSLPTAKTSSEADTPGLDKVIQAAKDVQNLSPESRSEVYSKVKEGISSSNVLSTISTVSDTVQNVSNIIDTARQIPKVYKSVSNTVAPVVKLGKELYADKYSPMKNVLKKALPWIGRIARVIATRGRARF